MQPATVSVENDKNGVSETSGIFQTLHGFDVSVVSGGVDVDVDEVVGDNLAHYRVFCCKIGKTQTPGTPVAAHLAEHIATAFLCQSSSLLDLLHGIEAFVIYLHLSLSERDSHRKGKKKKEFLLLILKKDLVFYVILD